MLMQLSPIFPYHVSESITTPTLTGIVVFSAMAENFPSTKNKKNREKTELKGAFLAIVEILQGLQFMTSKSDGVFIYIDKATVD